MLSNLIQFIQSFLDHMSEVANRSYLKGGQSAREFIIKKLDLNNYMKDQAWTHLLAGMKPDEVAQLKELLTPEQDEKSDDV